MRQELWNERLETVRPLFEEGLNLKQVADRLSISVASASTYARRLGISPKEIRERMRVDLLRKLAADGKSRMDAAIELGVSYPIVWGIAAEHSIEFRHGSSGSFDDQRVESMAAMFRSGKTLMQIGEVFGVSRERVRQIIKAYAGMVGKDGGMVARTKQNQEMRSRNRDAKCIEKHGCTDKQLRDLRRIGREMQVSGSSYNRTPVGAFSSQKRNALSRGIEWKMLLWDWWTVWQQSGKWDERGRSRDAYVMCRLGDAGVYEVGNVYIATLSHNSKIQPNNPYRSSHPRHAEVRYELSGNGARIGRKRKYHDLPIGVTMSNGRFQAQIGINGKARYLGTFSDASAAAAAYQAALQGRAA